MNCPLVVRQSVGVIQVDNKIDSFHSKSSGDYYINQ